MIWTRKDTPYGAEITFFRGDVLLWRLVLSYRFMLSVEAGEAFPLPIEQDQGLVMDS